MCAYEKPEVDPLDKLISIEWDIVHGLLKLLATGRSSRDKVRATAPREVLRDLEEAKVE